MESFNACTLRLEAALNTTIHYLPKPLWHLVCVYDCPLHCSSTICVTLGRCAICKHWPHRSTCACDQIPAYPSGVHETIWPIVGKWQVNENGWWERHFETGVRFVPMWAYRARKLNKKVLHYEKHWYELHWEDGTVLPVFNFKPQSRSLQSAIRISLH